MPEYIYEHPKTKKTITVTQRMTEDHVYVDAKGVKWNRIFTSPQASIDTKIDPNNVNDFIRKTGNSKGTMGDLFDRSRDLAIQRAKTQGEDPVTKEYLKNYSKKRKGKPHPSVAKAYRDKIISI